VLEFESGKPVITYPNPVKSGKGITLRFTLTKSAASYSFKLYTVAYRSIREKSATVTLSPGENEVSIDARYLEGLAAGSYIYVMRVKDNQNRSAVSAPGVIIVIK
jgi:hypothetical protein